MKRALLIGIDSYRNFPPLRGCVNDVKALSPLLKRHENGERNFDVRLMTGGSHSVTAINREQVLGGVKSLLRPGADFALLYFAGHGTGDGSDVRLVTSEGTPTTPGVAFSEIADLIARSEVDEIVVLLDCCFAGGAGTIAALTTDSAVVRHGVAILTASRSDQISHETSGRGSFSVIVEGGLEGGAADVLGSVNVSGLYSYISESFDAWEQRPTFKANIERLQPIRECLPVVSLDTLRKFPEWFPAPTDHYALDPSYEPDADPAHSEHEKIFAQLQRCRAAKLVVPVGEDHLYYAAIRSKSCALTPLGRHYWTLATKEQL